MGEGTFSPAGESTSSDWQIEWELPFRYIQNQPPAQLISQHTHTCMHACYRHGTHPMDRSASFSSHNRPAQPWVRSWSKKQNLAHRTLDSFYGPFPSRKWKLISVSLRCVFQHLPFLYKFKPSWIRSLRAVPQPQQEWYFKPIIFCCGGSPVRCRMFNSTSGLYLLDAGSNTPWLETVKNVSRHCPMVPAGLNRPGLRTSIT